MQEQTLKETGNKNLFDLYNKYIEITDTTIKGYNVAIESIKDLKDFLKDNGLICEQDIFIKLNRKYPIVLCGYGFFENKKVYFYCDLIRSRNTYNSDGLYTITLIIHNLENDK